MIGGSVIVIAALGITEQRGDQERKDRRDADGDDEVRAVAQLAHERALHEGAQLRPFVAPAHEEAALDRRRGRQRGRGPATQ